MSDNIAVKVEHVSKHFRLPTESSSSLRTTMVNYFKGIKGYREQQVLKDISFEVEKGDFFGIVGRNGSGKSTLLKIISQIYVPEKGSVTIDGKLVSFIELGVGFNPELTGRENVYLNGALLGFSTEEINEMYDDIVEFAELSEFMNQKLKNYSSGMQVRLAFSVAIQAKSDILVLDEILAVGDEAFQRKSREFFEEIRQDKSKTVILVTHDMSAVQRYCNKVIYIKDGKLEKSENLQEITNQYSEDNLESRSTHPRKKVEEKTRIWLEAKSNQVLSDSTDTFDFLVHIENNDERYQKEQLYVSYSLHDERRGGIAFDSGPTPLTGNEMAASIPVRNFHNTEFKITASLRKKADVIDAINPDGTEMIAFTKNGDDLQFIFRDIKDKADYALLKEI
ncbi:MAG: ABC transporter ATP-binding protein [Lactococcus raffinolactis]|jgi:ABC-2 type transport system ATP-binding protein|uniref:ATP-binding cassette domain-containing protein n=1 Tax=Pseudolactococcus raffinolactis TaxID=1366 RepID=A0A6H0UKP7_9LACT|nr:ABC transporter ATP-binding protein [Lactococcus raffinolactis]MDN5435192.1 ABC transporter ATP-binding protein [Acinetobacter sp.]MDN5487020.1 ABC transporter ATP-binding protein [Lactococcus lactis]MDN6023102.1 ABC transporter ATP-binding protein [Lactobacillus sp.]MDN5579701.1 ABC transporter ATP-binding protein [Lactococcus raffinolactis]MDN6045023.1 ABC transporter ATP-binding protein [Lactococcus raffinolactis]